MAKMSTMFLKICKLAGADASKVLGEYNKTARVRGSSTTNYIKTKDNKIPAGLKGSYIWIDDNGTIFTIPPSIIRKADNKKCVFHTAYQAVQTKTAEVIPPVKTAEKNKKS